MLQDTTVTTITGLKDIKEFLSKGINKYMLNKGMSKTSMGSLLNSNAVMVNMHMDVKDLKISLATTVKLAELLGYKLNISLEKLP